MTTMSASTGAATSGIGVLRRIRPARIMLYGALVVGLIATLAPFAWMFLGSVKPTGEIVAYPSSWLPRSPTLDNFELLLAKQNFGLYFFNSTLVAVTCVMGNLLFCSMAGYAFAKMEFAGKRLLFGLVLTMLIIPGATTFVPLFVLVSNMGLSNSYLGLILPFLVTPLGVFLMRQFIHDIPDSLVEAARLDGAGETRIFLRVIVPLCRPPLATLAILTFLAQWNNFLWPLVIAQTEDHYTLPVALALFSVGANGTNYGLLLAGAVTVVTPILLLFLFLQRQFVQGIASTGIK
ncbi:carbohydrate ABC transporter permease [Nonomuraea aurantiaca]|jgi:multiple sugar transport system permease protein|uniref:carbohydrate ABC transporter permease n=1 Tax=Nonomuraea aurantiaca TaxID=2878562 RepID=UPI001CD96680|nr:carbohydrate ABC transporter permease [Nonomuraea aurantiaca]MCA2226052.1 carbohydrate ABC transporter permease [Nonomuraea aurantiaca]